MKESTLVASLRKRLATRLPGAVVWKIADRATRGIPDLLVVWGGRLLAVEVKGPKGRQTELQIEAQRKLVAAGAVAIVARSWDDVVAAIERMGW